MTSTPTQHPDRWVELEDCHEQCVAYGWSDYDAERLLSGPYGAKNMLRDAMEWYDAGFRSARDVFAWKKDDNQPEEAARWSAKGFTPSQVAYLYDMCDTAAPYPPEGGPETAVRGPWLALLDSPAPATWVVRYVENGHFAVAEHERLEASRASFGRDGLADFIDSLAAETGAPIVRDTAHGRPVMRPADMTS